jgi:hypothetical protein
MLGMPAATIRSAASRMSVSLMPLLMTFRMRSDPASGAMVAVVVLLF